MITTLFGKKAAAAAVAALTLGAGMTMNAGEAEARFGRKGLIAAGVIGALATAAVVASSRQGYAQDHGYGHPGYAPDVDYAPAPVYAPQPVYYGHPGRGYQPHYGYQPQPRPRYRNRHAGYSETGFAYRGPVCKIRKERVWTGYNWGIQRVQVCR